jgi:hypothetical protein
VGCNANIRRRRRRRRYDDPLGIRFDPWYHDCLLQIEMRTNKTNTSEYVWTHFQYFTENGYLSLKNLIKVLAGGGSKLVWHIKHTVVLR